MMCLWFAGIATDPAPGRTKHLDLSSCFVNCVGSWDQHVMQIVAFHLSAIDFIAFTPLLIVLVPYRPPEESSAGPGHRRNRLISPSASDPHQYTPTRPFSISRIIIHVDDDSQGGHLSNPRTRTRPVIVHQQESFPNPCFFGIPHSPAAFVEITGSDGWSSCRCLCGGGGGGCSASCRHTLVM